MMMQGKCTGPKRLIKKSRRWEKNNIWEDMPWKEEWTGRERFLSGAGNAQVMPGSVASRKKWAQRSMDKC